MPQIDEKHATVASENKVDQINKTKTIYDVSLSSIFFRNLVAGAGRALGGIILYFLFMVVLYQIFTNYVYPIVEPFIAQYQQALQSINQVNSIITPPEQLDDTQPNSFPTLTQDQVDAVLNNPQYQQFLQNIQSTR
jgi:predicted PurR-regulated permease PerM